MGPLFRYLVHAAAWDGGYGCAIVETAVWAVGFAAPFAAPESLPSLSVRWVRAGAIPRLFVSLQQAKGMLGVRAGSAWGSGR